MRKFIVTLAAFSLFGIASYMLSIAIWGTYAPSRITSNMSFNRGGYGHLHSRLQEIKSKNNVDLLILGSSHAYRGFDNRNFTKSHIQTFNLGSGAQTPIQTQLLLTRYLQTTNPKTVIYEVYPPTLVVDGVESALDIISNDKNDQLSVNMAFELGNIKVYNTLIYAFLRELFGFDASFYEPIVKGNDTYIPGGFVQKKLSYYQPVDFEQKTIEIDDLQLVKFAEIIADLKLRNIRVILIYAPIPACNYNRYTNNAYYDSLMSSYAEYYNFNEIMDLNDSLHFYDSHHLNQNGVKLFNKALLGQLEDFK